MSSHCYLSLSRIFSIRAYSIVSCRISTIMGLYFLGFFLLLPRCSQISDSLVFFCIRSDNTLTFVHVFVVSKLSLVSCSHICIHSALLLLRHLTTQDTALGINLYHSYQTNRCIKSCTLNIEWNFLYSGHVLLIYGTFQVQKVFEDICRHSW